MTVHDGLMKGEAMKGMKTKLENQCHATENCIEELLGNVINGLMNCLVGNQVKSYKKEHLHRTADSVLTFREDLLAQSTYHKKENKKES